MVVVVSHGKITLVVKHTVGDFVLLVVDVVVALDRCSKVEGVLGRCYFFREGVLGVIGVTRDTHTHSPNQWSFEPQALGTVVPTVCTILQEDGTWFVWLWTLDCYTQG